MIKISLQTTINGWQCDIDHGPGHHGRGKTPAEAVMNASRAWMIWDSANSPQERQKTEQDFWNEAQKRHQKNELG